MHITCLWRSPPLTILRSYGLTVLRSYSLTVLRSYGLTVLRSYSLTVLRSYGLTVLRSYGLTVLQSSHTKEKQKKTANIFYINLLFYFRTVFLNKKTMCHNSNFVDNFLQNPLTFSNICVTHAASLTYYINARA